MLKQRSMSQKFGKFLEPRFDAVAAKGETFAFPSSDCNALTLTVLETETKK